MCLCGLGERERESAVIVFRPASRKHAETTKTFFLAVLSPIDEMKHICADDSGDLQNPVGSWGGAAMPARLICHGRMGWPSEL